MATVINNVRQLERIVRRKLETGVEQAAVTTARLYRRNINVTQEAGPPFKGPHSQPGNYPFRETGQGTANVGSGVDKRRLVARAGVKDDEDGTGPRPPHTMKGGMHLYWLSEYQSRRFIDFTLESEKARIGKEAKLAMRLQR